jgi:hypothetical protein
MEYEIGAGVLYWVGKFFYKATVTIIGIVLVASVTLFIVERTVIRRHLLKDILPMWSMMMAYFLTIKGRLTEIERTSATALRHLGILSETMSDGAGTLFSSDTWRSSSAGSLRFEMKRALMENDLSASDRRSLFAPVASALIKLKSDSVLFRSYSDHLSDKIKGLWSEKLDLVHAGGGEVESVFMVAREAEALHFYITRHLDIMLRYLGDYIAGDRHELVCENLANYWPYFLGQPDRLLVTAREDFLEQHLGERVAKTRTLKGRVALIAETLEEAREEVGGKVGMDLPKITVDTIWGR